MKSNVFSVGVIFYYLMYEKFPFEGTETKVLIYEIQFKRKILIYKDTDMNFLEILNACLKILPEQR